MVINRDIIVYEQLMLKQSVIIAVLASEEETPNKQVIQVDVDLPLVNNLQAMPEQQEEPRFDTEIDHEPGVLGGAHDHILVCDREHRSTKPSERYGYKDLASYAFLTSSGNPSTF